MDVCHRFPSLGDWRLAIGDWRLAIGDWRLAIGDWRLAAETLLKKWLNGSHVPQVPIVALGGYRTTYRPILLEVDACQQSDVIEELMTIPVICDSKASKELGIVDCGFVSNIPINLLPNSQPALALSHFCPSGQHPQSFENLPLIQLLSHRLTRHRLRDMWAWINTNFPYCPPTRNINFMYPSKPCGVNFYSRSLKTHLAAISQDINDTESLLLGPATGQDAT